MKHVTIFRTLVVTFFMFTGSVILAISLVISHQIDRHFNQYVEEKQQEIFHQFTETIDLMLLANQNKLSKKEVSDLQYKALQNDFYFTLTAKKEMIIPQIPASEQETMKKTLRMQYKRKNPKKEIPKKWTKKQYDLVNQEHTLGRITFYFFGPYSYTKHDVMFIQSMRFSLVVISFVFFIVAFFSAFYMAKRFSHPLKKVKQYTKQLSEGEYDKRLSINSPIIEFKELSLFINALSEQLEKQSILRKQLTSDISHELRTPLTTLKGTVEGMIDGIFPITTQQLKSCYKEIDRLTRLIQHIDMINELEENKEVLKQKTFSLNKVCQDVLFSFSSLFLKKNIDVTLIGENIMYYGDEDKLKQVFTNLISNSLKFTPQKGTICITLEKSKKKKEIKIAITDNGIGIDKEKQPYIFDRFYMADKSRSRKLGGQGIGLSIVKSIIQAHDGVITLESEKEKGTTFFIFLPIKKHV